MKISDFKNKIIQAKQVQAAGQANPNIREHVGELMIVTGLHISTGIDVKKAGLILDKITYQLSDGTSLDGFCLAATESARELIGVLGEGPYPFPLWMEILEMQTTRDKPIQYAKLIDFYDPEGKMSFAELEEGLTEQDPDRIETQDGHEDPNN